MEQDLNRIEAWPVDLGDVQLALSCGVRAPGRSHRQRVVHRYAMFKARGADMDYQVPTYAATEPRARLRFAQDLHRVTSVPLPHCLQALRDSGGEWWPAFTQVVAQARAGQRRRA